MIPPWIIDDMARELDPPAYVMKLSEVRSAENTLLITRTLLGTYREQQDGTKVFLNIWFRRAVPDDVIPARYQPHDTGTRCNLFTSDAGQIHRAPLPHRWRITEGGKLQWMSANDMTLALRTSLYPGWSRIEPAKLGQLDIAERAELGLPTVATWFNNGVKLVNGTATPLSGHIVWVVPTPPGKTGIYVTGAGRTCVDQCPIAQAFGAHVREVEFYGHP